MNIKEALAKEHSKKQTMAIVKYIGDDKKRFAVLLEIFMASDYRLNQRSAWPLSYVCIAHPKLIKPHFGKIIKKLNQKGNHDAVIRNILRLLQEIDIPEKYCVTIFDTCMRYTKNAAIPHALRAFSITLLGKICKTYPELKPEVELVLSELKTFPQPPSLTVRIRDTLKVLQKL